MNARTSMNRGRGVTSTKKKAATGFSISRRTTGDGYAYPKAKVVPAGVYRSEVKKVTPSTTNAGDDAIDFFYELTNASSQKFHVRQRYPLESGACGELCDRLIAAGLEEGSDFSDAIGLEETVEIVYHEGSTLGSIVSTDTELDIAAPKAEASSEADEDDDFDDFLEDEDEEDGG